MQSFEANDIVYIRDLGYCQLIKCGRYKSIKLKRRESIQIVMPEPTLTKHKYSLDFDPECLQFEYEPEQPASNEPEQNDKNNSNSSGAPPVDGADAPKAPEAPSPSTRQETASTQVAVDAARSASVISNQPNIVTAKLYKSTSPNFTIYTPDFNLTKIIKVRAKTLLGERRQTTLHISISSTILQLKNKIIQGLGEVSSNFENPRLLCVDKGQLTQYSNNKDFIYATKIVNQSKLLLLATLRFSWDSMLKGPSLTLTNSNKTIQRQTPYDEQPQYQFILGSTALYSGKLYFQVKIDKSAQEEDLIIGFAKKDVNLKVTTLNKEPFWGYMCMGAKKVGLIASESDTEYMRDFGTYGKQGQVVGVLLQVNPRNNRVSLSCYSDGKRIGKVFSEVVESPVWPAVCVNSGNIQFTLNNSAEIPFDVSNYL